MNKAVMAGVLVGLLIAVAGGGYYLLQNIDALVKDLIEETGTESVGTPVTLSGVVVNLREGTAQISGLAVANPDGFSPEPLLTMANIRVAIDTGSLTKDVYVINDVAIDGLHVLAEQKGTGTNVQALVDGMPEDDAASGSGQGSSASTDALFAVKQINVAAGTMELRSEQFGSQDIALKAVRLSNLGSETNGMTPDELSDEVSEQLLGQIKDAVSKALTEYLRDEAKSRIKEKLGEKLGDLFKR